MNQVRKHNRTQIINKIMTSNLLSHKPQLYDDINEVLLFEFGQVSGVFEKLIYYGQ